MGVLGFCFLYTFTLNNLARLIPLILSPFSVDELTGAGVEDPGENSEDPDSANPDSPKHEHRLRRQRVKRGGNYSCKDRSRTAAAATATGGTPPSPSHSAEPSGGDDNRSHPDDLGSSPDPTAQDGDFQGYVPSAYSRTQPQRKPVGVRHSLPISNPATSTSRNRNVLPTHDEAEGSGMTRSASTKTGREPRFV